MIHLQIQSEYQWLIDEIIEALEGVVTSTEISRESTWVYELTYSRDFTAQRLPSLTAILDLLNPLECSHRVDPKLPQNTISLKLGSVRSAREFPIYLVGEPTPLLPQMTRRLSQVFTVHPQEGMPIASQLRYGGAPPFIRDLIRWTCSRLGVEISDEQVWGEDESDLYLTMIDPSRRGAHFRQTLEIHLSSDLSSVEIQPVINQLRRAGYQQITHVGQVDDIQKDIDGAGFIIDSYQLAFDHQEAQRLIESTQEALDVYGVDSKVYPVFLKHHPHHLKPSSSALHISLPLRQWGLGRLIPRGGDSPLRWNIEIQLDDLSYAEKLETSLNKRGFSRIQVTKLVEPDPHEGAVIVDWGTMRHHSHRCALVRAAIFELGTPPMWCELHEHHATSLAGDAQDVDRVHARIYTRDFDESYWNAHLSELARPHTLILLGDLERSWLLRLEQHLNELPWLKIERHLMTESVEDPDHEPYQDFHDELNEAGVLDYLFGTSVERSPPLRPEIAYPEELEHDKISRQSSIPVNSSADLGEGSDEDHSSIQDWLMDSLHDSLDDALLYQPCVTFGAAPLVIVEWLRLTLSHVLGVDCMARPDLETDDLEILVEIPVVVPQQPPQQYRDDETNHPEPSLSVSSPKMWLVAPPPNKSKK